MKHFIKHLLFDCDFTLIFLYAKYNILYANNIFIRKTNTREESRDLKNYIILFKKYKYTIQEYIFIIINYVK